MDNNQIKRHLKSRHLAMIAIGGSIGSGLFMASGETISIAGADIALLAYLLVGIMVYFLMSSLGEMSTYMPVSGAWSTYASNFVHPSLGFALGWTYWISWILTTTIDIMVATLIIYYWEPMHIIPKWAWGMIFFTLILFINSLSVKVYGESEFWFSLIKVFTILIFIILGILIITGIIGTDYIGFKNLKLSDNYFSLNGILTIISVFIISSYSFQGTELVGIAAGESADPKKNIPKSIRNVFWRILLFYIFTILIIGLIIPQNSPYLLGSGVEDIAKSPFTLVLQYSGITFAAMIMNAIILTALLSAANSGMYSSTRMLYALAKENQAFKIFAKTNNKGVPIFALLLTAFISVSVLILGEFQNNFLEYMFRSVGIIGLFAWIGIIMSHLRFRKIYLVQGGNLDDLFHKAKYFPIPQIIALIFCIIIALGIDDKLIIDKTLDFKSLFLSYYGILIFLLFFFYHKIKYKTKAVNINNVKLIVNKK